MTAPDRITVDWDERPRSAKIGTAFESDLGDIEYIRRDPAALAGDDLVQAMIGAVVEEAGQAVWDNQPQHYTCGVAMFIFKSIRAIHPDATAALAARDKRIRDAALEEAAKVARDAANALNADAEDAHQRGMSQGAFHLRQEAEAVARVAAAIDALKEAP